MKNDERKIKNSIVRSDAKVDIGDLVDKLHADSKESTVVIKEKKDLSEKITINANKFVYKKKCFIALILGKSKEATLVYVPVSVARFSINGNQYFNTATGTYLNEKMSLSVYFEGVSLPIDHSYLQYESVYELYFDDDGLPIDDISKIPKSDYKMLQTDENGEFIVTDKGYYVTDVKEQLKGLEFDSKTMDILLESNLTENMAYDKMDRALPIIQVGIIVLIILGIASAGASIMPLL